MTRGLPLGYCAEILLIPADLKCRLDSPGPIMRDETLALHAGFDADPATRAVAVPIYQTAAYQFDSARIRLRRSSIWKKTAIVTAASPIRR